MVISKIDMASILGSLQSTRRQVINKKTQDYTRSSGRDKYNEENRGI